MPAGPQAATCAHSLHHCTPSVHLICAVTPLVHNSVMFDRFLLASAPIASSVALSACCVLWRYVRVPQHCWLWYSYSVCNSESRHGYFATRTW